PQLAAGEHAHRHELVEQAVRPRRAGKAPDVPEVVDNLEQRLGALAGRVLELRQLVDAEHVVPRPLVVERAVLLQPFDQPLGVVDTDYVYVSRRRHRTRAPRRGAGDGYHLEALEVLPQLYLLRPDELRHALRGDYKHVPGMAVALQLGEGRQGAGG